ncbi:MAG TPA: hypothetical protein PK110_00835 [Niabella sp.]|jgi:hypothetical protein|nr:hypothetical protein [Chitinophagaceae bacterium]HRN48724.1 hypothetical protein [Niabella sp.]HRO83342.1 hypothetical protein [Niabella sp.]HUN04551.1 hypothetical protein [Niabella sp.]
MKKLLFIIIAFFSFLSGFACSVCEKQQPRLLKGITHGTGPQSEWDLLIISGTAAIVVFTLFFSIKMLVKPGERSSTHIKRTILKNEL